ncbi:hypothetical protein DEJ50_30525 [Streptomyces venezuelae]|uniref:Lipoprotein n=1 Tax=Streptomyces venezuelae TaxID=54571 RepID=A0A5P2DAF2_STRVZ|nr:hypothetical protein DEJ50_30525 [Streptomyces venezuelae]
MAVLMAVTMGAAGCAKSEVVERNSEAAAAAGQQLDRMAEAVRKAGPAEIRVTARGEEGAGGEEDRTGRYSWHGGLAVESEMSMPEGSGAGLDPDGRTTYRFVQGRYYYQLGASVGGLGQGKGPGAGAGQGKAWFTLDFGSLRGEAKGGPTDVELDPMAGLELLKGATGVSRVGEGTPLDRRAVHYRVVTPQGRYEDALRSFRFPQGAGELVTDVWVDDRNLPVRLRYRAGTTNLTLDFLSFGVSGPVEAPSAADTTDLTDTVRDARKSGA